MANSPARHVATASWPKHDVWRVGRHAEPARFSWIDPGTAGLDNAGNRFDVPGGGVLYASSQLDGCFGETLSRFRPSPKMIEEIGNDPGYMNVGAIPTAWRLDRTIVRLECNDSLPFVDVESIKTCNVLTSELGPLLVALGINMPLDVALVRGHGRLLTRAIATWAYTQTDQDDVPLFSGIRYKSRIATRWTNWAIFSGTKVETVDSTAIEFNNPNLQRVAKSYGLTLM